MHLGSADAYLQQLRKDDFRKSHFLYYSVDEPKVRTGHLDADGIRRLGRGKKIENSFPTNGSTGRNPKCLAPDPVIFRFFSYTHEGPIENRREEIFRIRFFQIFFHLEDETIMIMEDKEDRAQIKQGKLLNRQRVPRHNDLESHLNLFDLNVNKEVDIFSRQHFIYKCDPFTRETMQRLGINVPDEVAPPISQSLLEAESEKHSHHRLRRHINEQHHLGRFLQHDREVLRFYAYWDDRERIFGERHYLVIDYYLADQTTQILRKVPMAYGKEKLEVFVRRSKIPKNPRDFDKVDSGSPWPVLNIVHSKPGRQETSRLLFDQAQLDKTPETYTETDFRCGSIVNIYSRPVFIHDCDAYTTWYYKEIYGYDMRPLDVEEPVDRKVVIKPPAYNGYGSEEDSLRNCSMLVPKPPILDVRKYLLLDWDEGDPTKLIFKLRMVTTLAKNKDREFIMSFSLNDNSIYIYEKNVPQGAISGSFHGKKAVKKGNDSITDLPQYIEAEDLCVGREFEFHEHPFTIVEVDECTAKFMERHPERFPFADPIKVLQKFRRLLHDLSTVKDCRPLKHRFEAVDPILCGIIDWDTFVTILMDVGRTQLNPHEYLTIARHYKIHKSADKEQLKQLFRALIQNGFRQNTFDCSGTLKRAVIRADPEDNGFLSRTHFIRAVKACRAPINYAVLNLYLDVTTSGAEDNVNYNEFIGEWDWINNPSKKLADIPQNVGKNFDFEHFFGYMVVSVSYKTFLMDIEEWR